jgi:hypothetical protein
LRAVWVWTGNATDLKDGIDDTANTLAGSETRSDRISV